MAVNPSYAEPDTSSAVSRRTQNPSYGENRPSEAPQEPMEPLEEPGQGEAEPNPEETLEEPLEETPEEDLDDSLTHAQLDEIAAERGVELPSNLNKDEKIELLNSL